MYTTCIFSAPPPSPRVARENRLKGAILKMVFQDKQFRNEPKRCKTCKSKRVAVLSSNAPPPGQNYRYSKVETRAICSGCGKETTVPFRPTQGRTVFCRECFH